MKNLLRLTAVIAMLLAAPAVAETTVRDSPWRLTGISKSQRVLHIVYEGGGCSQLDGQPQVDTSVAGRVTITVRQSVDSGADVMCPQNYAFIPLDVDLGAKLAGRRVRGGPHMGASFPAQKVPRLIGLRKTDAVAALKGQGLEARVRGKHAGVVTHQSPRPGAAPGRVTLRVG